MPTYSPADFDRIGAAIGKDGAQVAEYADRFEAAARWYRSFREGPERVALSVTRRKMNQISKAASKLLNHLEIYDYRRAQDGHDTSLLEFLSGETASEADILKSAAAIGRLLEIFDAIDAAQSVERAAREAAFEANRLSKLLGVRGRRGDHALNVWLADMMSIYKSLTGKDPRLSVVSSGQRQGKSSGPLLRFLDTARAPVDYKGVPLSLKAVRERVRALLATSPRQK